ncbi:hypothetical protein LUZ60_003813 [Juncus effusus]|nr:hypothetical protein LUZ60_003813 [Juncus effusus]
MFQSNAKLDATLGYLNKILLEEEIDENVSSYREELSLQAIEKPLYDILSVKYPYKQPESDPNSTNLASKSVIWGFQISEFNKGVEEGMKFLPNIDDLTTDFQSNNLGVSSNNLSTRVNLNKEEKEEEKGKKKSNDSDSDLSEGRNRKILMPYLDEPVRDAKLDEVLLRQDKFKNKVAELREIMQTKETQIQEELIDIKDLLIQCSHSIASNDHNTAKTLIKRIREKSSLDGDGTQRLGVVISNAFEARLNGTGSEIHKQFLFKQITTSEFLKAHLLFITVTPFERVSYHFANQTILNAIGKATKVHIIDFGIVYGFQWPSFIQALADSIKDRVVKVRITGIDFPQPGFRPAEQVERTGRRLEDYARSFNVPFEYQGIAAKWETIRIEDLKIKKDEVIIVNSLNQFRQVGDETITLESPRNQVLNLIWRIKPRLFIQGIFNRTYSPFFITRFKQVMMLYSTVFDMLDALIPRDNKLRQSMERDMLARKILNIIACEGSDWVEKPETYKQWHVRNLRAKFEQLPLDPTIIKGVKDQVRMVYKDKRFLVEEDTNWLLQGWSGNRIYALSTWRPKRE